MVRAVQAANPDVVFVAAYPPDTVGIVRAARCKRARSPASARMSASKRSSLTCRVA